MSENEMKGMIKKYLFMLIFFISANSNASYSLQSQNDNLAIKAYDLIYWKGQRERCCISAGTPIVWKVNTEAKVE